MLPVTLLLAALLGGSPASRESLEATATREVKLAFERVGRSSPESDPALTTAARDLAQKALRHSISELSGPFTLTAAVSSAGGFDPSPRAIFIRTTPAEQVLATLSGKRELAAEPTSHIGVGVATDGTQGALVVLMAERLAQLRPFPRRLSSRPPRQTLCGELRSPLAQVEVYVTSPGGTVVQSFTGGEPRFCAPVPLSQDGRHTVEVIGRGPRGPEVAALFFTEVGPPADASGAPVQQLEPSPQSDPRGPVREQINALRRAHRLGSLEADAALERVAQAYADRMSEENFFAHVSPDGLDLRGRLQRAGYRYQSAGENLGLAPGPLAAHFGIEHSPAHRKNLLDPDYTRIGVGVSRKQVLGSPQVIVVELLASLPESSGDPLVNAYAKVASLRAARKLPPLDRREVLEQLARAHARRALELDLPRTDLPGLNLHDRIFEAVDAERATVDVFVADSLGSVAESRNLLEPGYDLVGIGAIRGNSRRFGKDRYWVVVIYAASR